MEFKGMTINEELVMQISEAISKVYNTPERKNKLLQFELDISNYLREKES